METELGQEALDSLPRIPDEGAADQTLGRSGVRGDGEDLGGPVEAAPVEDRAPVVPEQGAVLEGDRWERGEVTRNGGGGTLVEPAAWRSSRIEVEHCLAPFLVVPQRDRGRSDLGEDRADGWVAADELGPDLGQPSRWAVTVSSGEPKRVSSSMWRPHAVTCS